MGGTRKEEFLDWLRDAHALEKQAQQLFEGQAERYDDYPNIQVSLSAEVNHSRHFQRLLDEQINRLGSSASAIKDTTGNVIAGAKNVMDMAMTDEPVKGVLALHTFTQFEIGSFKILKAAASAENQDDVLQLSESIVNHLEARAAWLEQELESVTRKYLSRKAA